MSHTRPRLRLPSVTLCAVSSSNLQATVRAMDASLEQVDFAQALLFTDRNPLSLDLGASSPIAVINVPRIASSNAYSHFVLEQLADHINTSHCLIVQWGGRVINAERWAEVFLAYDYIGAGWPQFDDGHNVGNGGFSLRSLRLMRACQRRNFTGHHPEDVAIARTNRAFLESQGLKFAPVEQADRFSTERASEPSKTFGYHGVFHMPLAVGPEQFWEVYRDLSNRESLWIDFGVILGAVLKGRGGFGRGLILIRDRLLAAAKW